MLRIENVKCLNRTTAPPDDANIIDDVGLSAEAISGIITITIYKRLPEDCPFARGNWMIDLKFKDGCTYCVKLPCSMSEEQVKKFCQPLIDILKNKMN
jgi:hypothetical protein